MKNPLRQTLVKPVNLDRPFKSPFNTSCFRKISALKSLMITAAICAPLSLISTQAHAEGSFQIGLEQFMNDISATTTERFIKVDILNANEVINLSACGTDDTQDIQFTIFDQNFVQVAQNTITGSNVSCTSDMTSALTNPYKYTALNTGSYYVSIDNIPGNSLNRYDITVTSNAGTNPDPTGATGIIGRVSSQQWAFNTGAYSEATSTDADYYILTPGGFANTNYVWELNLNNFAGFVYDLKANNQGVDAPNSGFSTSRTGNNVTQLYPLYINYPAIADPSPAQNAAISGFRFIDEDGQDNVISPGGTVGVQDSGVFEFTTDALDATYAIYIDVNQDGIFGNTGDVQLNGPTNNGFNSVFFDGNDNNGNPLPIGTYQAQLGVRLGEFHFVANDAETSGGGAAATGNGDGLTVWEATAPGGSKVATAVYWDDVTVLGAGAGGTSNVPDGGLSGTPEGTHTWGSFTSSGFGNNRFIDTYVFGNTTLASFELSVSDGDNFTTAMIDITDTSTPGEALTITVTDGDQNTDSGAVETVTVTVVNDVSGESETLTLTETGVDTGIFENTIPTTFGIVADTDNNGTFNSQSGDTFTASYIDAMNVLGATETITDTGTVSGGANGAVTITDTSNPGDTLTLTVTDSDLAGQGSVDVSVTNTVTGETETVTLTEGVGTPGLFEGTIGTTFGTIDGPAGDNDLNTQNGDNVVVSYVDVLNTSGTSQTLTDTNIVSGGVTGTVTITPNSTPGDGLSISVNDTDLSGDGTLTVSLENPVTGETESLTLTESTMTAGLFEGTVATVFGTSAGTNDDGTFNTQSGDTIVVTYNDALMDTGMSQSVNDTNIVGGGVDGTVNITPMSNPGDTLTVSVTDADLAGNGTLIVSVVNTVTGETESVTLTESTTTPGLFESTIATVFGTSAGTNDDGTFNTQSGDTLTVTYNDVFTSTGGSASPTDNNTVNGGVDGTVSIQPGFNPGETVTLSVADVDLAGTGTVVVSVVNTVTGETDSVTLTESTTTPGLFEGTVATVFGTTAGTNGDGTFNTQSGDTLTVTYTDALTSTGGTATPMDSGAANGGADGTVTITPTSNPGDTVAVSVTDADLVGTGTLTVTVVNADTGETETLTLTESTTTPGLFEGTVATVFGTSAGTDNDGTFNTQSGNTLTVTYNDALTSTGQTANPTDSGTVNGGSDATVSLTPESMPGDTLALSVTDIDLNTNPSSLETTTVSLTNTRTGEVETVIVTETGPNTGVFTATLNTSANAADNANNSGVIFTNAGDTLTLSYTDMQNMIGGPQTLTAQDAVMGLAITKTATLLDGGDGRADAGDILRYTFTVRNAGLVTLSNITITDAKVPVTGGPLVTLASGATDTTTFTADYALSQIDIDAGQVTNTAIANGVGPSGAAVTGTSDDPNNTMNADPDGDGLPSDPTVTPLGAVASMALTKIGIVDTGPDGIANVGDAIDYTFTVTNTGNVSLTNITITDPIVTVMGGPITALSVGTTDTTTFTARYVLTQADLNQESVTNSASATAEAPNMGTVTAVSDDPTNATNIDPDGDGNPSDPTITSLPVNHPPIGSVDSASTQMGTSVAIPVLVNDSDPENQTLTITAVTQGTQGSVTFQPDGTVIYTPVAGHVGTDSFTYTICDTFDACDTVTVTVTTDDDTPSAVTDAAGTQPDTAVILSVLDNDTDPNNDPLRVTEVTQPMNGTVAINPDGTVTYTPNPNFTGVDTFTYTACDEDGHCDTATVTVDVSDERPQAMDDVATGPSNTPIILATLGNDTDPNGDTLTVTSVSQPANGSVVLNPDGTVTYTPNPNYIGTDVFTYEICDTMGNCDTAVVTLTIENQDPIAAPDTAMTPENRPVTIAVLPNDTDAEGPLTVTAVSTPSQGTASVNPDGTLLYTPNTGYTGTDSFIYTACDNANVCVEAGVTVTVSPETPMLTDDTGTAEPGDPTVLAVLENDTDPNGDILTVTDITQPANGTVIINADGTLTITPNENYEGPLSFTYTACDEDDNCATANVLVEVEAVSPDAMPDVASTPSDTPITINPLLNDTDPNGGPLTVSIVSVTEGGTAEITPAGEVLITPNPDFVGDLIVTYEVCDTDGNCDTSTITITVDPPVANVEGVVFLDVNGDDVHQPLEPLEENWIVEVVNTDGTVIATTTTDENGFYTVMNIPLGDVDVRFRNPATQVQFGVIQGVTLNAGLTTIDQNLPIDPSGVVYDAVSRDPIGNVNLVLLGADNTPLPDVCFVDAAQQGQLTDPEGMYRFDLVPGANAACPITETEYRIRFTSPPTHNAGASTLIEGIAMPLNPPAGTGPFAVVPQAMAPAIGDDTSYYLSFVLGQGDRDVINNHIPLDPVSVMRAPLSVTKTTPRTTVSFGDIIPYTITVTNTEAQPRFNLDLVDIVPPRFRYVTDSARVNGVAANPDVSGRDVTFGNQTIGANETVTIELVLTVGPGVTEGQFINQALVRNSLDGGPLSPTAEATVQIVPSPVFDCSEVIGKVFDDKNKDGYQSRGEEGLAGVRLVTAKGLTITTDAYGRYHIACAAVPNANIGSNFILKMDERSLPTGYRVSTENPRVIRLTRGKTSKLNFGASIERVVTLDLTDHVFVPGSTKLDRDMAPHIDELIAVLKSNHSILRLNYHDYEGLGGLAEARLDQVAKFLEYRWEEDGCCYPLIIERKLLEARVQPTQFKTGGAK